MHRLKVFIFIFSIIVFGCSQVFTQEQPDTNIVIYGWKLDDNLIQPEKTDIDTILTYFQVHNPIKRKYISTSNLGSYGTPYVSNYFFDRNYSEDVLFLNSYSDYFSSFRNTTYINTRKPFTHLFYINGASKPDKVEYIELMHSQNPSEKFNFGFNLNVISNKGMYRFLNVSNKSFKAFSSYTGEKYFLHSTLNVNRYLAGENGGINDSQFLDEDIEAKLYETKFSGVTTKSPYQPFVTNKIRYLDGMISQKFVLFTIGKSNVKSENKQPSTENFLLKDSLTFDTLNYDSVYQDSVKINGVGVDSINSEVAITSIEKSGSMAEPTISHVFFVRRCSRMYSENSQDTARFSFYDNFFINPIETYDSISEFRISNKIQLDFKTRLRSKVIAGIYGSINHDFIKYSYNSLVDTNIAMNKVYSDNSGANFYVSDGDTVYFSPYIYDNDTISNINKKDNISNLYLNFGVYGKFWTHFQSHFYGILYFAGQKAGETHLNGSINTQAKILDNIYKLKISGSVENLIPSYQYTDYFSNHYIWQNDFNAIKRISLSSKLASPSKKFELSGDYCLLYNYIYLTESGPKQESNDLNMLGLNIQKEFAFWKFHSQNKISYQVSNSSTIEIPAILFYGSFYFDKTWHFKSTNGKIRTMLGIDFSYNSSFNGYFYNPSMAMFYQTGTLTIGDYPYIDVWLNVRLKRTRFFAKAEHLNSLFSARKDYYNAISYPANPFFFKFGISWTFYN